MKAAVNLQKWRRKAQDNLKTKNTSNNINDFNSDNAFVQSIMQKKQQQEERDALEKKQQQQQAENNNKSPSTSPSRSSARKNSLGSGSGSATSNSNSRQQMPDIDVTAASPLAAKRRSSLKSPSPQSSNHHHPHHHNNNTGRVVGTQDNNNNDDDNNSNTHPTLDPMDIYSNTSGRSSQRTSRSRSARSTVLMEKARKRQVIRAMTEEGNVNEKLNDDELDELPSSMFIFSGSNCFRLFMLQVMQNWWFQQFILLCILFNAVLLGVDQPLNDYPSEVITFLFVADFTFSVIFAIEMVIKIIALGVIAHEGAYLRGGWNILDFVIVVVSIINLASDATNLSALRVVRVLRPLRSVSRIPELRILIQSLLRALPQVVDNILLFFFLLVIFAVVGLQIWPGRLTQACYANFDQNSEWYPQIGNETARVFPNRRCGGDFNCRAIPNATVRCEANGAIFYPDFRNFDNFGNAALFVFKLMVLDNWTDDITNMMDTIGVDVVIYFLVLTIFGFYCACNLFFAVLSNAYSSAADSGGVNAEEDLDKDNNDAATWIDVTKLDPQLFVDEAARLREEEEENDPDAMNACSELCCVGCGGREEIIEENDNDQDENRRNHGDEQEMKSMNINNNNNNDENNSLNNNSNTDEQTPTTNIIPILSGEDDLLENHHQHGEEEENSSKSTKKKQNNHFITIEDENGIRKKEGSSNDDFSDMPTLIAPDLNTLVSFNVIELSDEAFGCVDRIPLDLTVTETAEFSEQIVQTQREEFDRIRAEQEEVRNTTTESLCAVPKSFRTGAKDDRHILRCLLGWIVGHRIAELVMLIVTMLNTIALAIDHHDIEKSLLFQLDIISLVCTVIFTIEIVLKLIAFGPIDTLSSPFNALDFIIVLESLIQYVISGSIESSGLAALRVLRTLRVLKLLTMFPSLQLIVRGVLHSMDSIGYLSLLILLHLYVFAILGMQLFGTNYKIKNPDEFLGFGTTYESFLISFVVLTGDSWTDRMSAAMFAQSQETVWIPVIYFILLFFIGNFVLVNLMVAIILDHMQELMDGLEQARSVETHPPILVLPPAFLIPQPKSAFGSSMLMNNKKNPKGLNGKGGDYTSGRNLWSALTVNQQGDLGLNPNADVFLDGPGAKGKMLNKTGSSNSLLKQTSSAGDLASNQNNSSNQGSNNNTSYPSNNTSTSNAINSEQSNSLQQQNNNNNNLNSKNEGSGVAPTFVLSEEFEDSHQVNQNSDVHTPIDGNSRNNNNNNTNEKQQKSARNNYATSNAIRNMNIDEVELEDTDFYDKLDTDILTKLWAYFVALFQPEKIRVTSEPALGIFERDNCIRAACIYLHSLPLYNLSIFLAVVINVVFLFIDNPFIEEDLALSVFIADIVVAVIFFFDMLSKIIAFGLISPDAVDVATEKENLTPAPSGTFDGQFNSVDAFAASGDNNMMIMQDENKNNSNNNNNDQHGGGNASSSSPSQRTIIPPAPSADPNDQFFASNINALAQIDQVQTELNEVTVGAYLTDFWNVVDGMVTIFSVVGIFVEDTKFLRAFRTFRLIARIDGARIILEAVIASLPMVLNGLFLTLLAFMTFGVLGVQLFKGSMYTCSDSSVTIRANCTGSFLGTVEDGTTGFTRQVTQERKWINSQYHFDDFPNAILTLFLVVAGDSWATVMYTGMNVVGENIALQDKASPENALFFVAAYVVGNIFCLNMIIGILLNFFQRQKDVQDGSAFLTEKQRKFLRARRSIEQTWLPTDEDVLAPAENGFSKAVHRMLTYMWWEAKEACCCCCLGPSSSAALSSFDQQQRIAAAEQQNNNDDKDQNNNNNLGADPSIVVDGEAVPISKKHSSREKLSKKRSSGKRRRGSFGGGDNSRSPSKRSLKRGVSGGGGGSGSAATDKQQNQDTHLGSNDWKNPLAGQPITHESTSHVFRNDDDDDDLNDSTDLNSKHQSTMSGTFSHFQHHSSHTIAEARETETAGILDDMFLLDKMRSEPNVFGDVASAAPRAVASSANDNSNNSNASPDQNHLQASDRRGSLSNSHHQQMFDKMESQSQIGSVAVDEEGQENNNRIETTIAQTFFYLVITLNFIINAIEYNEMPESYANTLLNIELGCLIVFSIEWLLKVAAYGWKLVTSSSTVLGWFLFDTIIIVFGFVSIAQPELRFLSFLRALRLMKLLRGTGVEKLLLMLIRSFRQIINVFIVLLLSYFVFAVAGVAFFANAQVDPNSFFINENRNFKNVPRALLILYQASTTDGWGDFASTLSDPEFCEPGKCISRALTNGFFIVFLCIITWIGLQMFVAILIEVFDQFRNDLDDDDPMKIGFTELRTTYDRLFGEGAPDVHVYEFIDHIHELPLQLTQFSSMEPGPHERLKLLGTLPIAVKSDMTICFRDIVLAFAFKHFQIDVRSSSDFLTDVFRGTVFGLAFSAFQVQAVRIIHAKWERKSREKSQSVERVGDNENDNENENENNDMEAQ